MRIPLQETAAISGNQLWSKLESGQSLMQLA